MHFEMPKAKARAMNSTTQGIAPPKIGGKGVHLANTRNLVFDLRLMNGSGRSRILFDLRESGLAL